MELCLAAGSWWRPTGVGQPGWECGHMPASPVLTLEGTGRGESYATAVLIPLRTERLLSVDGASTTMVYLGVGSGVASADEQRLSHV